ncbi:hypothetical protein BD779DRAFT_1473265 [Infundibulicybe gibba]|nr:hypothetical protein BD779DRAFT_1473265 [Infundibulicybe gibba]
MPAPAPFSSAHNQPTYPALYLYPLNDSFIPKHIALLHNQHVKIGRQTNAKTAPGERNGFFDSKVLSRQHAEVWEEANKIFIRDVKSSNGTFINGERLSPEGLESEPFELKSDDIVEFGIDIVGEDNKTIIHHKVAARVVCVFSEQDAQVAARAEQHQQQQQQQYQQQSSSSLMIQSGPSSGPNGGPSTFNFSQNQQRRPQMTQQGMAHMRPPGKSGLTFDHILSRLQGELQKSRETGSELQNLNGAMNEIHDTLGGTLPSNIPPYPHTLPPVRPSQSSSHHDPASSSASPEQPSSAPAPAASAAAFSDLLSQLHETQASLATHIEKIRALEGVLAEQETIKQEVKALRDMVETRRHEPVGDDRNKSHPEAEKDYDEPRGGFDLEDEDSDRDLGGVDDDDDARSVNTIVPHELERVEEEDEEQIASAEAEEEKFHSRQREEPDEEDPDSEAEEERRQRRDELGRPRTPEPNHMGMRDDDYEPRHRSSTLLAPRRHSASSPLSTMSAEHVLERVDQMSDKIDTVVARHNADQPTILALTTKIEELEAIVKATQEAQAKAASPPPPPVEEKKPSEDRESLTQIIAEWKKSVEGQWSNVQEEWNQERERLSKAREEWENKVRLVDSGLEKLESLQSSAAAALLQQQQHHSLQQLANGDAVRHSGLATPSSPRSLSADSGRHRARRRRSSGRARSASRSRSGSRDGGADTDTDATLASVDSGTTKVSTSSPRPSSPLGHTTQEDFKALGNGARSLATPEPSLRAVSSSLISSPDIDTSPESELSKTELRSMDEGERVTNLAIASDQPPSPDYANLQHPINVQTAVGVLVLSVAAAAVLWRVKPE